MTKVLFLLSTVAMVAAFYVSYLNRSTFVETRLSRHETDAKTNVELKKLSGLATEIVDVKGKVAAASTEMEQEQERLAQSKIKLRNAVAEADRATQEIEQNQAKIADYKAKLNDLPVGMSPETINEDINKLKTTIADNETKAAQMLEQVTTKQEGLKKVESQLSDVVRRIEDRKKAFDQNSMTATIVAVNNDWGFVVIDGGQNKGITVETKLLVTRGDQTIGKLSILAVDGNKTVANIVQKSLRSGLAVAPGDRVILETLYQ
jgi:flagellar biosynthesis chaperone FliJ